MHVVSLWLGHSNALITLRAYGSMVDSRYSMADVP